MPCFRLSYVPGYTSFLITVAPFLWISELPQERIQMPKSWHLGFWAPKRLFPSSHALNVQLDCEIHEFQSRETPKMPSTVDEGPHAVHCLNSSHRSLQRLPEEVKHQEEHHGFHWSLLKSAAEGRDPGLPRLEHDFIQDFNLQSQKCNV